MADNRNIGRQPLRTFDRQLCELRDNVARLTEIKGSCSTAITNLYLFRREATSEPESVMYEPSICILAQGVKRVFPGDSSFVYDSRHFLVASVDIPTVVQVIEASPERPCLGVVLIVDRREISQLLLDGGLRRPRPQPSALGISAGIVTPPLLNAASRLVDLLNTPDDITILAPIYRREILYRLLTSEQGERFWQIATAGSQSQQISHAINWLKENFDQPLRIDDLAAKVNMSTSTFHHHFRELTARSPLQYQKWLRLNEARRLMLVDYMDVSHAAFAVGYESPSQFSRDYSRVFGNAPLRDITRMRQETQVSSRQSQA